MGMSRGCIVYCLSWWDGDERGWGICWQASGSTCWQAPAEVAGRDCHIDAAVGRLVTSCHEWALCFHRYHQCQILPLEYQLKLQTISWWNLFVDCVRQEGITPNLTWFLPMYCYLFGDSLCNCTFLWAHNSQWETTMPKSVCTVEIYSTVKMQCYEKWPFQKSTSFSPLRASR